MLQYRYQILINHRIIRRVRGRARERARKWVLLHVRREGDVLIRQAVFEEQLEEGGVDGVGAGGGARAGVGGGVGGLEGADFGGGG